MNTPTYIFTITGPSGWGKSTLVRELVQARKYHQMENWTTRKKRWPGDDDYIFCSDQEFNPLEKENKFISLRNTFEGKYGLREPEPWEVNIAIVDGGWVQMIRDRYALEVDFIMIANFLLFVPREVCEERIRASSWNFMNKRLGRLDGEFLDDGVYKTEPINHSEFILLNGLYSIEELKKTTIFHMESILANRRYP